LAYDNYWKRGSEGGEHGIHVHPWYYYLQLLTYNRPMRGFFWSEGLIVGLALIGILAALSPRGLTGPQKLFGRFLTFYTLVLVALYSAIPYKTPWCLLSFLHGMILLAGIGAWALLRWVPGWPLKSLVGLLLGVGTMHLGWQCYQLNYTYLSSHERNPYVYAHTVPDAVQLGNLVERLAQAGPEGHALAIHMVTPENCWPLPWYLRQFPHLYHWQDTAEWCSVVSLLPAPSIIVLTPDVESEIEHHLPAEYTQRMTMGLRQGVKVTLYVRDDLWKAFLASQQ
jgi:predicted membrane-bound mannosyltransferase